MVCLGPGDELNIARAQWASGVAGATVVKGRPCKVLQATWRSPDVAVGCKGAFDIREK